MATGDSTAKVVGNDIIPASGGNLSLSGGGTVKGVPTPSATTDAANKSYVDAVIVGVVKCAYMTTAALPANTYANGTAGVGATLTANANGALPSQDGQSPAANDVVFVNFEAAATHDGPYVVTQVGDGSHPYILTRHQYADTAAKLAGLLVQVALGAAGARTSWYLPLTVAGITVGTTALNFQVACGKITFLAKVAASPVTFVVPMGITSGLIEAISPGGGGGGGGGASGGAQSGATEGGGGGGSGGTAGGSASSECAGSIALVPGHTISLNPGAGGAGGAGGTGTAGAGNVGSAGGAGAQSTITDTAASATLFQTTAGAQPGQGGAGGAVGGVGGGGAGGAARTGKTGWGTRSGTGSNSQAGGAGGNTSAGSGANTSASIATVGAFFGSGTACSATGTGTGGTGSGTLGGGGAGSAGGNAGAGWEWAPDGVSINGTDGQGGNPGNGGNFSAAGNAGSNGAAGTYGRGGGGGGGGGAPGGGSANNGAVGGAGGAGSDGLVVFSIVI